MRRLLLLVVLSLLLAGCGVGDQPAGTTVGPADPTAPAALTTPLQTPGTPLPHASALRDLRDPSAPELIEPYGEAYRLQPSWQVDSISYLYQWPGGFEAPTIDYQQIKRAGAGYRRNDSAPVDEQTLHDFLAGLDRLYPSQGPGLWPSHSDSSPRWSIEILGSDGHRVYISSSNIGNPGHALWTILYNGRYYLQHDGSLAAPLAALFPGGGGI